MAAVAAPPEAFEPETSAVAGDRGSAITPEHNRFWSFQPVSLPPLPDVLNTDWPRSPIDRFILARLESDGLQVVPPADKRTLIRRASFDLIGLPPTPEEVEAFVADDSLHAFASVVDRLLASPHYGERWARHWLDVARYGEDQRPDNHNFLSMPEAYRYRDWVVRSFNEDLPYDQFVVQQIAGDLIDAPDNRDGIIAVGYFALGPIYGSDGNMPDSVARAEAETLEDRIDTLCRGFLGLTVVCARCHDHKFDPIPTEDYYSLAGVFRNTKSVRSAPLIPPEVKERYDQASARIRAQEQLLAEAKKQEKDQETIDRLQAELGALKKSAPRDFPTAHSLADAGSMDMNVAIRGNLRNPGEIAPRRFLRIASGDKRPRFTQGSGRLELARAVVSPENPLTARVMVNRIWQHHFGRGIVATPSNFGMLGERPTHPELLDWLATRFIESGWSIKQLHREIMLSATYQLSSAFDQRNFDIDGDNRLLWRMSRRRLDVEAWRDALLAVSGELEGTIGGPPNDELRKFAQEVRFVDVNLADVTPGSCKRRTLYLPISRGGRFSNDVFLRLFDFPDPNISVGKRTVTTVPQQQLFALNSEFMVERAKALAKRVGAEQDGDRVRVRRAYAVVFGRPPTAMEQELALEFLAVPSPDSAGVNLSRWEQYTQVLLSSNEFMFIR